MRKYMILHYGFKKPTPEIMGAWGKWFESIADKMVDQGGFHGGAREISGAGTKDLPMGMESITATTSSTPRTLMKQNSLLGATRTLRASESTKSSRSDPPSLRFHEGRQAACLRLRASQRL